MKPKVSIIIPCYNAEKWIEKCILSAINQNYENTEVIFVDNESTDRSLEIAKEVQERHPKLLISSAPNLYKYSWEEPVNEGLKISSGEYITILGADDFVLASYVSNFMRYIEQIPFKILAFQSPIRGVRGASEESMPEMGHFYETLSEFKELLFQKSPVTTPTVVYNRELYERNLLNWDSKYLGAADYNLYFQLADSGVFIFPAGMWLGYYYRWHKEQATWGMHEEETSYDEVIKEYWHTRWSTED